MLSEKIPASGNVADADRPKADVPDCRGDRNTVVDTSQRSFDLHGRQRNRFRCGFDTNFRSGGEYLVGSIRQVGKTAFLQLLFGEFAHIRMTVRYNVEHIIAGSTRKADVRRGGIEM